MSESSQTFRKSGRYFISPRANFILNQAILKGFDRAVGHETLANSIQVKGTVDKSFGTK